MPIKVLMPALSPTMEEGKLASWHKKVGDMVVSGDVLCEIETDKATMEVEAVDEGKLAKILVADGTDGVKVNAVIAVLLEEGEDDSALDGMDLAGPAAAPSAAPAAAPAPKAEAPKPAAPAPAAPAPALTPAPAAKASGERVFASPLARRVAADNGIDVGLLSGTGPHGRVVKRDVESAIETGAGKAGAAPKATGFVLPQTDVPPTLVPHSTMRKVIASRLSESKQTVPHFYLTVDCEVDALMAARKQMNDLAKDGDYKLSVNDFIIKAVAMAMRTMPTVNVSWSDEAMIQYNTVDISVAVATPGGLITPVVRNADFKGLKDISAEVKDLAKRARDGKLMPEEYTGGGFTISNLGMYGSKDFQAIINPPQAAILAVGAGEQRPVAKNGQLAVATVMSCTLSCDHRAVDGALAAEFMALFKQLIENPAMMLL